MQTNPETVFLPSTLETGELGVCHLKRYWAKSLAKRNRLLDMNAYHDEWAVDTMLFHAIGVGIEQMIRYFYMEAPEFGEFEAWVLAMNGGTLPAEKISWFNGQVVGKGTGITDGIEQVLGQEELSFWDEQGYVILKGVVSRADCDATIELMCAHLGVIRDNAATWYQAHKDRQGIMVQLFQHPLLQQNRDTPIIRKAYEQLWGRKDIMVNTDRVGFNPPVTPTYHFPGPGLHWDVSLALPIPFGLQGILYLADTAANQGAFTLVPGFQHRVDEWIHSLPPGANPRTQDLHALGALPIAAEAGDFIIWHHALPHGSSPNTSKLPRFVQYINYLPIDPEIREHWV